MKPGLRIKQSQIWGDLYLVYNARHVSKFSQVARAWPSQVLSVGKDVDSTASPSSLFQCLNTCTMRVFHFIDNFIWARLHYPRKKVHLQYIGSLRHHFPEVLPLEISMDYGSELRFQVAMLFPEEVHMKNVSTWRKLSVQEQRALFIPKKWLLRQSLTPISPWNHITPPIWFLLIAYSQATVPHADTRYQNCRYSH